MLQAQRLLRGPDEKARRASTAIMSATRRMDRMLRDLADSARSEAGTLELAKGLSDTDEPDLWHRDYTGHIVHWVECGQPDERRLLRAAGRADRVSVLSYSASTPIWWAGIATKLTRASHIEVWQVPAEQSQALAELTQRTMQLQVSVQDGHVWVGDATRSVELTPTRLNPR